MTANEAHQHAMKKQALQKADELFEVHKLIQGAARSGKFKIVVTRISDRTRQALISDGYTIKDGYEYLNGEGEEIIQQHISW